MALVRYEKNIHDILRKEKRLYIYSGKKQGGRKPLALNKNVNNDQPFQGDNTSRKINF